MSPLDLLKASLRQTWFLWTLMIVNLLGSIYGFYWYANQLHETTPTWFCIFVPDSPTGSSFFTLFLITLLIGRRIPALEAFAAVTNFKYGVWAVSIILSGFALGGQKYWTDFMLMFSHGGMALESLLYAKYYTFKLRHLVIVGAWTLLNDVMDYGWNVHPWLPDVIEPYTWVVGLFTFLLSIFCLVLFYCLTKSNKKMV